MITVTVQIRDTDGLTDEILAIDGLDIPAHGAAAVLADIIAGLRVNRVGWLTLHGERVGTLIPTLASAA